MVTVLYAHFSEQDWDGYELTAIEAVKQGKSLKDIQSLTFGNPPRRLPEEIKNYCVMRHSFLNPALLLPVTVRARRASGPSAGTSCRRLDCE